MTSIHIDGRPVPLINDVGVISLPSPGRYILVGHFAGNSGETLSITVEAKGQKVLQIKKSQVPSGENAGAGIARFDI